MILLLTTILRNAWMMNYLNYLHCYASVTDHDLNLSKYHCHLKLQNKNHTYTHH